MDPRKGNESQEWVTSGVLVTGGAGYVGARLCQRLAQNKKTVVSLYRTQLPEARDNIFPVCSNLDSPDLLAAPLRGVATVFHAAWVNSIRSPAESNIAGLKNLLAAVEKSEVKRFVFISALGAEKNSDSKFLAEKYAAEQLVFAANIPEIVVVRPALLFGEGSDQGLLVRSILKLMRAPLLYPVPKAPGSYYPLFLKDLVDFLIKIESTELSMRRTIVEIAGIEAYKVSELFRLVSSGFMPSAKLPIGSFFGEWLVPLFEREQTPLEGSSIREVLKLNKSPEMRTKENNPLARVLPDHFHSFRDAMTLKP